MSDLFGLEVHAAYRRDSYERQAQELARLGIFDDPVRPRRSGARRALGAGLVRAGLWLSRDGVDESESTR